MNTETVEQFLARGGKIQKCNVNESGFKKSAVVKKSGKMVSAQALLDAAIGTDQEQEVINYLTTQGFEVEYSGR